MINVASDNILCYKRKKLLNNLHKIKLHNAIIYIHTFSTAIGRCGKKFASPSVLDSLESPESET